MAVIVTLVMIKSWCLNDPLLVPKVSGNRQQQQALLPQRKHMYIARHRVPDVVKLPTSQKRRLNVV